MGDEGSNPRLPRCKRASIPSEDVAVKPLTSTLPAACTNACTRFRQAQTSEDNAGQDICSALQLLLQATGVGSDNDVERQPDDPEKVRSEGTGRKSMLEVVRMLVAMAPEERASLVALIKALG
ncbi:MAG: hypothetical protein JXM70_00035 [Pirellulales bacterium]|nr:hypothetical protein [Pirellulales bacterium]